MSGNNSTDHSWATNTLLIIASTTFIIIASVVTISSSNLVANQTSDTRAQAADEPSPAVVRQNNTVRLGAGEKVNVKCMDMNAALLVGQQGRYSLEAWCVNSP